ncbi:RNA polymerase sigma factor [Microbacterium horticulturae]|uniref:RNA polymerase sigma factor n=1 Tax=Microbacterium horticulturae TaxID=3028316 RepID=A0ABY8BX35_9MICO|nr:RNA polymerase sigma factor [Microbacterium sp. KACC 23027]WEG08756.1 RNA polymerase sigma factor [Microbacterium sp. KACC 23027]
MTRDAERARVEAAVRAHAPALTAYFVRRITRIDDVADLVAETLLAVWKRASALPVPDDEARAWMFGIAHNVLRHHYRGIARRRAVADRLRDELMTHPRAAYAPGTEFDELYAALAEIAPLDRDIIGLVHWEGFTLLETSRILRMKEGTVRSRYHRARAALRERLSVGEDLSVR